MNIVIIQARFDSTRFPGKILKTINGKSLLEILILRLKKSKLVNKIIVATTRKKNDDEIIKQTKHLDIDYYRGSSNNVLQRYYYATRKLNQKIENVIRITSDCPLIDSKLLDKIILKHKKYNNDYTSNTIIPTYPDGMDIEIFSYHALKKTFIFAKTNFEKEHVTPFIKNHKSFKRMNIKSEEDFSKLRLTLDYEEDLKLLKKIFKHFKYNIYISYNKIINYQKKNKKIFEINSKFMRDEGSKMNTGNKLWKKAKKIIPGGSMLYSKRQEAYLPEIWPTYFSKSKGCSVWDLDNKKYLDFSLMGVGTNLLGYSNPNVDKAVLKNIKKGNMTTLNCPEEVELADELIKIHPWSNMAKFTRSGGEANAVAVRIARTFSDKKKILVCGYHGWHDWYLSSKNKNNKFFLNHLPEEIKTGGIPKALEREIFIFRYNDFEGFEKIYNKNKNQIGIVKMEVSRNIPPKKNFLKSIRKFCDKNKLILIFDECTSGFRNNLGGLHLHYKVNPDILILGKALGNGYAINAVLGKKKIMQNINKTFISSTFWTERVGPTAAIATLKEMKRLKSWHYVSNYGRYIKKKWEDIFEKYKLDVEIIGLDSMPLFNFKNKKNNQEFKSFITLEMLKRGFLATNSVYVSIAHSPKLIKKYIKNFEEVIKILKEKIDSKTLQVKYVSDRQINR